MPELNENFFEPDESPDAEDSGETADIETEFAAMEQINREIKEAADALTNGESDFGESDFGEPDLGESDFGEPDFAEPDFAESIKAKPKRREIKLNAASRVFINGGGAVLAVIIAAVALAVSLAKTELTIAQGELFVESGSVNKRLENLIKDDIAKKLPGNLKLRDISVTVELNGENLSDYRGVSSMGAADGVSATVVFIPQESVSRFAEDCRAVLDVMKGQGLAYDDVVFTAEDSFTKIRVKLNGRFNMDISKDDIIRLTYYFGSVDAGEDIPDLEDLPETAE
ncbi:MAG: hypothetical protein LBI38_05445 [Oscillospiraceae bacterium]|jgi:hypothetical protein|nr:hypothetical protein [Oscillospiraceae bacterium]